MKIQVWKHRQTFDVFALLCWQYSAWTALCLGASKEMSWHALKPWLLLQGSDAVSMLKEKLRAQLVRVAGAYSRCVLCLEGSAAFELSAMSHADEILALGRRCDLALSIVTVTSSATLEVG